MERRFEAREYAKVGVQGRKAKGEKKAMDAKWLFLIFKSHAKEDPCFKRYFCNYQCRL